MEFETLLQGEIQSNLQRMAEMDQNSDEYKQLVDATAKLIDRAIDLEKIHVDAAEKDKNREQEHELKTKQLEEEHELKMKQLEEEGSQRAIDYDLKLKQLDEDRKDRFARNALGVLGIVVPTWLTVWGTKKSFKFEEEGTITTTIGRGFIGRLLPKK